MYVLSLKDKREVTVFCTSGVCASLIVGSVHTWRRFQWKTKKN